jgi:signal transduction histidine kinase
MTDSEQGQETRDLDQLTEAATAEELNAVEALREIQRLTAADAQVDLAGTALVKRIFSAREVFLVLLDDEYPSLAFRKQVGGEPPDWINEDGLHLECTPPDGEQWERAVIEAACADLGCFENDGSAVILCLPLTARGKTFGALVVACPNERVNSPFWKTVLETIGVTLANGIAAQREQMMLKVSNADLEARCWEIMNSRNTLRALFDSIPASVYIIDRNYTIIAINQARSIRANATPRDLVGKKCYDRLYGRNEPCQQCRVQQTLQTATITSRTNREWIEQDRSLEWEITTFPIQEMTNVPHQAIVFEQDISEKRGLEANLIQSEKLAAVGQLAAGVAHEINNPLAAVIANAQLLRREMKGADPDALETLQLIETAGVRAAQVVTNLLGIARKETQYEYEAFSLNDNIRGAVSLVHHELVNRSIEVQLSLQDTLPEIIASRNYLQGVWINMIVNAMDAIDSPGGMIKIGTRYENQTFVITIEDNGRGIPEDHLTRIFEPFYTTKIAGRGTGLGLSVCLRVIKEHQGNLMVDSKTAHGTRFTITLPDIPHNA